MKSHSYLLLAMIVLWIGFAAEAKYSGGTGEPNDPYRIATAEDLNDIGNYEEDWNKHFILVHDVNIAQYTGTQFKIVGRYIARDHPDNKPFTGIFDGNDHKICNFTWDSNDVDSIGLFGYVSGGQIKNLRMENVDVNAINGTLAGGLVGYNTSGTITNCYVTGTVSGMSMVGGLAGYCFVSSSITNCCFTGSVSGPDDFVGGLVGENFGTISSCCSISAVSGFGYVGGLVGNNWTGPITDCYFSGNVTGEDVVGGLVGYEYGGRIKNCYSTGRVTAKSRFGGLVGTRAGGGAIDSFWDIQTSGQTTSSGGIGKTTSEMQDPNTYTDAGWDFVGGLDGPSDIWAMPAGGGYPILWWQLDPVPPLPAFSGGSGTPDDPYIIASPSDINSIGYNSRLMDKHFVLIRDINMAQEHCYTIGNLGYRFKGVFDGKDHKICNLTSDSNSRDIGLFGYVGTGGHIRNLGIENGSSSFGGLMVISNRGTITKCYSTGSVSGSGGVGGLVSENYRGTIINCCSSGSVSGNTYVGGLVGHNNEGSITNCYSNVNVFGQDDVGGLSGRNSSGQITNCYSVGNVSGTEYVGGLVGRTYVGQITNCYSTGIVSGNTNVGGLVGYWSGGSTTMSFWDIQTSDCNTSASGTGKTTAQMQTRSTFTSAGWDFVNLWDICDGTNYPRLRWQIPAADWVCPDGVGFEDFSYLADSWQIEFGISDLSILCEQWLEGR